MKSVFVRCCQRLSFALCAASGLLVCFSGCKRQHAFETLQTPNASNALQRHWAVPDFRLVERDGGEITHQDLRGKVWVADFFYTTCPGPCPMMTSRLSDLQKATSALQDVRLVSISTDPVKDTPEMLRAYADKFKAGKSWLFLTGDKQAIFEMANKGFKLALVEDPTASEPITHSTKLILVDQAGMIRGFYEGVGEDNTQRIVADIERLLRERP